MKKIYSLILCCLFALVVLPIDPLAFLLYRRGGRRRVERQRNLDLAAFVDQYQLPQTELLDLDDQDFHFQTQQTLLAILRLNSLIQVTFLDKEAQSF